MPVTLLASGKIDTSTKAFELQASGDRIQLARLGALSLTIQICRSLKE